MFKFFFIKKYKDQVSQYVDLVYNRSQNNICDALSIDKDKKPREEKEVSEPKFSRELDLDNLDTERAARRYSKDSFNASLIAQTMKSHLAETEPILP